MAQHKQLTWNELRVGIFVLMGIALLVVAVFYVTASENPLSAKYRLRTFLPEVAGLSVGAPVRLDGIDVGNVDDIQVNPAIGGPQADRARNIIVTMRISKKYQNNIRTDSVATTKTEGLLGNQYLGISRGFTGNVLGDFEEVTGKAEQGISELVATGTVLEGHMNGLIDNVQGMITDVREGKGTLGQLVTNRTAYDHLDSAVVKLDAMLTNIQAGQGTFGQLYATDTLHKKLDTALDKANNMLEAVQQQKGTLGKLVYDTSFHDRAREFLDKGNGLMDDVRNGKGTLSKLLYDDSLFTTYKQAGTNLSNAMAKLNSNEGTVGKLFNDPKMYDNLAGLSGDLRLFMNDFRKDPKKYLHVKFSLF